MNQLRICAAVGIVIGADQKILIAQRPSSTTFSGFWEFPGGKIEEGETAAEALVRELQEEINITPTTFSFLTQIEHVSSEKIIVLDAFIITDFIGMPQGLEGQPIVWVDAQELDDYTFLTANKQLIDILKRR